MKAPLVSVICLCYNHQEFIVEAIESVLHQSYSNVELIVVDDASTDGSQEVIRAFCEDKPAVKQVLLDKNLGNCAAFNKGWRLASGKYIIDLAADDYLLPERLSIGVEMLEARDPEFGVHFANVRLVDRQGKMIEEHLSSNFYQPVPEGFVFKQLLEKYFINPAGMMIANAVLEDMSGYDESLAYEDFDLWVRSSSKFQYCYSPEVLVVKRQLSGSHSSNQYKFGSKMLASTFKVCEKAYDLCRDRDDYKALRRRLDYEMRKSLQSLNLRIARQFLSLLKKTSMRIREVS
jgi:glycosyltransferase involved in cell wall biosynthesis